MSIIKPSKKLTADIFSLFGVTHLNLPCTDDIDKERITKINSAFKVSNVAPTVYGTKKGQTCFTASLKNLLSSEDLEKIYAFIKPIFESGILYQKRIRNNDCYTSLEQPYMYHDYELIHPENWFVHVNIYYYCYIYSTSKMSFQVYANCSQKEQSPLMGILNLNGGSFNTGASFYTEFDESHIIDATNKVKESLSETFCKETLVDNIINGILNQRQDLREDVGESITASITTGMGRKSAYLWVGQNCPLREYVSPDTNEDF